MTEPLRLMCIFAHPDDESLGTGGTLAKYAAEGIETYVICATLGERGWQGEPKDYPGPMALGKLREAELRGACQALGVSRVQLLGYIDGDLDQADVRQATARIVRHLREIRPQVVITFGPDGAYGHPDHIAICQLTTGAIVAAAAPDVDALPPHCVSKLYYMATSYTLMEAYQRIFGDLVMLIDGGERRGSGWPDWQITTRIDAGDQWEQVWRAVRCHRSQLPAYELLAALPEERHRQLWGDQTFYRVFSHVNGGRAVERDLFEGLRDGP
jgi:LmbE family N-acetylglucosaminyl deacetylase